MAKKPDRPGDEIDPRRERPPSFRLLRTNGDRAGFGEGAPQELEPLRAARKCDASLDDHGTGTRASNRGRASFGTPVNRKASPKRPSFSTYSTDQSRTAASAFVHGSALVQGPGTKNVMDWPSGRSACIEVISREAYIILVKRHRNPARVGTVHEVVVVAAFDCVHGGLQVLNPVAIAQTAERLS